MDESTRPRRFSNRLDWALAILAVVTVVPAGLLVSYFLPRHDAPRSGVIATYYGLGWHDEPGFFGKNWVHLRIEWGDGCWQEVDMDGYGYSPTRGYYPDGAIREESVVLVNESDGTPNWLGDPVLQGKYYDINGKLVSEVTDGTGRQILHDPSGSKRWELELRDGKRVEHIQYSPSGHVLHRHRYDAAGRAHGLFVSHYEDGTPRGRGRFRNGEHVGIWYGFHPDGSVRSIEDNNATPSTLVEFDPGERFLDPGELSQLEQQSSD